MARLARPVSLAINLTGGPEPLRMRISDALLGEVRAGRLRPGDALPTTRALAADLGVARTSVVAAYDELAAAGYLEARPGSGTFLAPGADRAAEAGAAGHVGAQTSSTGPATAPGPPITQPRWSLDAGRPDTGLIDRSDWRRAWRSAASASIDDETSMRTGHPELQRALAEHLRRTRGVAVAPEEIVILPGASAALSAVASAAGLGGRTVAMEDPGYTEAPIALQLAGAHIRPVRVDGDGLDPDALQAGEHAAYVTPAHQYPLGGRMPAQRRADIVAWARESDAIIIEDDYDGEFRYGVAPLPALRAIDGADDVVAYVGTASKVLTPSVRVAWLIPPRHLLAAVREVVAVQRLGVDRVAGLALAHFIDSGAMSRHLARAGRTYAARRGALVDALARHLPGLPVVGVEAGLHVVALLPPGTDDAALTRQMAEVGVAVSPLSRHAMGDERRGLVLGYARLPEGAADEVVSTLASVIVADPTTRVPS